MQCKNCGIINEEDAIYCKKCGSLLQEDKKSKRQQKEKNKPKTKTKVKTKVKRVKQKVKVKDKRKNNNNQKSSFGKSLLIFILTIIIIGLLGISLIMGYHIYDEEKNIEVPNLYHLSYEDAELVLAKKTLKISKKTKTTQDETEDQLVIAQSKMVGKKVSKNTMIKVTVGKYDNSYVIENFTGKNVDEVKNILTHNNIKYKIIEKETNVEEENDIVISQTPKKGTKTTKNITITIKVGKYIDNSLDEDNTTKDENIDKTEEDKTEPNDRLS